MGCFFSSEREAPISMAVHVEIDAPSEYVWELLTDIQALPKIVSHIEEVEFLGQREPSDTSNAAPPILKVGMRWIEKRRFDLARDSKPEPQIKTIIRLDPDEPTRSLGFNIGFPRNRGGYEDIVNTCTFTIQTMSHASCVLICSAAFHAAGMDWIPKCCLELIVVKYAKAYLLSEVHDYRRAAEEKFQKRART